MPTKKKKRSLPPMVADASQDNQRMVMLLLINISLALFWGIFLPIFGAADYFIGFVVGTLALGVYERDYGQRMWWTVSLIVFMLWEILLSNIKLAWWIMQPKPHFRPGIVAVPLTLNTELEIIMLVTFITLTPGTLGIDMRKTEEGQTILYIHGFTIEDPDKMRKEIKHVFERRLALVTRGGWNESV